MKIEFEAGDVVYLKSGSPPMTVSDPLRPPGTGIVDVQWFDGPILIRDAIHKDCLVPVEWVIVVEYYYSWDIAYEG